MQRLLLQRQLPAVRIFDEFLRRLRESYTVIPVAKESLRREYYDSFDWRLFKAGLVLELDHGAQTTARLRQQGTESVYQQQPLGSLPVFVRDWPSSWIREQLRTCLDVRALLYKAALDIDIRGYQVRDGEGKILASLHLEQFPRRQGQKKGGRLHNFVRIWPLRGYEKEGRRLLSLVERHLAAVAGNEDAMITVCNTLGVEPATYSTRLYPPLQESQTSCEALAMILLHLLSVLEQNLEGVCLDLDSEFLHDLRIAGRRSRTLLTEFRGILPTDESATFRDHFSWLSKITSAQRDLDVFLLRARGFAAIEPDYDKEFATLCEILNEERKRVHAALVAELQSERFASFAKDWRRFLTTDLPQRPATATGSQPVTACIGANIWRLYRKMVRQGKVARRRPDQENLHRLRKTGKKLRYMLEAARSLYPERQMETAISQLRRLQNILGEIVDAHVQQQYLLQWGATTVTHGVRCEDLARALRKLDKVYRKQERKAVQGLNRRLARFDTSANHALFATLFDAR